MSYIIGILIGLVLGAIAAAIYFSRAATSVLNRARADAKKITETSAREAQTNAKEIELAAKEQQQKIRVQLDQEIAGTRLELKQLEQRLGNREDTLDRKLDTLTVKERQLDDQERQLTTREKNVAANEKALGEVLQEQRDRLLNITNLSVDQAKSLLLQRLEDEYRGECGELIRKMTEQAQEEAREKSREIIVQAIQRYAADQTAEHTVSSVSIPNDEMKGRVIGREGRNIRAFEKATGVDVIIDDTPGVVIVSCFDPVRRQVAKLSLEKLVADGRIHPARIEELVAATNKEMEEELLRLGKQAAQDAQLPNLPRPIIPMLGRLAFRTSYGQNVLKHSLEVAYLTQVMADELGLDGTIARRAGLLHDIGKAMDHEQEGGHPQIGMEFLRRFNESEAVLNACLAHHGDVPPTTPYTPLVMAADAISASRPGARRESLERYIKRLQELEELATGFNGVRQAYAIQAGREVRVIVDARSVDDKISAKIARDIAQKIQRDLTYPGEIKVTLIREVRTVEYAR